MQINLSISTFEAPWYCSSLHIISETHLRSWSSVLLIVFDKSSMVLIPTTIRQIMYSGRMWRWRFSKSVWHVRNLYSHNAPITDLQTFTLWLTDCVLFAFLFLKLHFSVNTIWLPEFKPEPKVLPLFSSSCASVTFTLAFTLARSSSNFISSTASF